MEQRNEKGQTLEEFLAEYDETRFRRPSNTVDMIMTTVSEGELKVLLVRRKNHPFINDWAMPGGFVEFHEDLDQAVLRELKEETSFSEENRVVQLHTFGKPDRDPRTRVITTVYLSMTPESNLKTIHAADDAADAAWFTMERQVLTVSETQRVSLLKLSHKAMNTEIAYRITESLNGASVSTEFAQDSEEGLAADHIEALAMALDYLKEHGRDPLVLSGYLPEKFSVRQLRLVSETLLKKKMDRANFRRDMLKYLLPCGQIPGDNRRGTGLYRFNYRKIYQIFQEKEQ